MTRGDENEICGDGCGWMQFWSRTPGTPVRPPVLDAAMTASLAAALPAAAAAAAAAAQRCHQRQRRRRLCSGCSLPSNVRLSRDCKRSVSFRAD